MIPLSLCDCDYFNKEVDVALHSHCQYLEQALQKRGFQNPSCFNFALPGGIVSDDYIAVRALMQEEKKPKVLVIGMTVRDFIDRHVSCAAASPVFKYLQRFTNIDDLVSIAMPEIWQRIDYSLGKGLYLEGKRLDIQVLTDASIKALVLHAVPQGTPVLDLQAFTPKSNNVVEKLARADEHAFVLEPHTNWAYEDNSSEYRKRFGNGNDQLFKSENQFLDKLLILAQEKQIRVVIINMPLTAANIALTPKGYYSRYMNTVRQSCAQHDAEFYDFNDEKSGFVLADFKDTAHMNAAGGKKLLDKLVDLLDPSHARLASKGHGGTSTSM